MNCSDALELVDAYHDGELDLVKSLEIEQHLGACPACKVRYDQVCELGSAIRAQAAYYAAPPALRARVRAILPRQTSPVWRDLAWRWGKIGASLALFTLLGLALGLSLRQPRDAESIAQEVVASHVRSLMANHLTDIASSDQHTVKPWIDGKLDFAPPVTDLAAQGYPLAGGRLDYLGGHAVMALVYRRYAHVINLFIWPQAAAPAAEQRADMQQGYNLVHFTRAGMVFWAVSDLNADELKAFAALL